MLEIVNQIARKSYYSPDREFLVTEEGERYTYSEFDRRINQVANGLADVGVESGSTVGVLVGNNAKNLEAFLGGLRCGCTVVPLNFRGGADEITRQIQHDEVDALVVGDRYRETLDAIREAITVDTVIGEGDSADLDEAIRYQSLLDRASTTPVRPVVDGEHTAFIYHTGGTTGVPKSVPWRPGHVESHAKKLANETGISGDDTILVVTPLFHIASAMMGVFMAPYAGSYVVLLNGFSPEKTLDYIDRERISTALLVPSMMRAILAREDESLTEFDGSSLETVLFTGETISARTERELRGFFPNAAVWNVFGATEIGVSLGLPPELECEDNCVGLPFADRDVSIRNADGSEVEQGTSGELWIRGKDVPDGFFKMPDQTAERYGNGETGDWFTTGDVGYVDEDGLYYVVGRLDDRITRGGENIQPSEIEDHLLSHDAVDEAAAFGVDHNVIGETVAVAVVPKTGVDLSREEVLAHCEETLASYKHPEHVLFRERLPRTDAGKFDRKQLRDAVEN